MGFLGVDWNFPVWTRNKKGDNFYDFTAFSDWSKKAANLSIAQTHPLLSPAMLFVAKIYSQTKFEVRNINTGTIQKNHPLLKLLRNPNYNQTQGDILESLSFTQQANGVGVLWKKAVLGMEVNSLYVLDYALITFPESLEKGNYVNTVSQKAKGTIKIIYDEDGENLSIPLSDLMFFYDMPNAVNPNPYIARSRLDGLKQTLYNTMDSVIAKNIILKSNGKELITGAKDGFVLQGEEKEEAERMFNDNYGLSMTRKRGLITRATLNHKSLHIIMRDLGHEESIRGDASVIFTALHLPEDIYSINPNSKSTYKNANQSLVSYIQNEVQPTIDAFTATMTKGLLDNNHELVATYDHLPVMLDYKSVKYTGEKIRGEALAVLRGAGIPDEIALEMLELDPTIQLADLVQTEKPADDGGDSDEEQEEKILQLIHNTLNN